MSRGQTHDVLVVGGGAAGLACAAELKKRGVRFLLIEARSRLGGRIFTERPEGASRPVELGAEFIHGATPEILALTKEFHLPFVDVNDSHLIFQKGHLKEQDDFFANIDRLMPSTKSKDQTVEDYLNGQKIALRWRQQFRSYVEGFHAADISLMGTKALAATVETDDEELNGINTFRHLNGYDQVVKALSRNLSDADYQLNSVVENVDWKRGSVEVQVRSSTSDVLKTHFAKKLILTLPIGALKSMRATHAFRPDPFDFLDAMEMGHVQRLVLRFRERFWENDFEKPVSFFLASPEHDFPTWWTESPLRTSHLIAWQGGPRAHVMSEWSSQEILSAALSTLSKILGRPRAFLERQLVGNSHHNWSLDPYAKGAYSYIRAGEFLAAQKIKKPLMNTIYFAGEGTCFDSTRGTVHGAIRSGQRAARLVMKI